MTPTTATTAPNERLVRRVALASGIGSMLEFYDFYLYGALSATIFGTLFFHSEDPAVGTLLALATFGVGFVARPIGGIIAGHFGDKVGRKSVLIATLALMGISTVGIGLLPTYETIGTAAPILLVTLRVLQGLAHGGEWGGASIMTIEHAPEGRRGFYGACPQMGIYAGLVLASLVLGGFMLLPEDQFNSWGWRIPFILGAVLMLVGLWLRRAITESPEFAAAVAARAIEPEQEKKRIPLVEAFRTGGRGIFVTFAAKAAETCTFYLITVFALTLAKSGAGQSTARTGILVAAAVAIVTIGVFGVLADRIGTRNVYMAGAGFMVLFAFPFFWLAGSSSPWMLLLALIIGLAVGHSLMYAAQASYFSALFDTTVRFTGASLGYQLGAAIVGGFTPLIAASLLLRSDGATWPIALYISGVCVLSLLVMAIWGKVRASEPVVVPNSPAAPNSPAEVQK
ncbi:MFS transporter [Mycolicibacterium mengxianglii]|uniref:MFS transporter n=1 Tax=Mycolicibacterium mengxianglii TaxID=2736649 RepID=UPI0018D1993B|nr:MFS transporter [Mycolicibacterium mengxianglii]